MSRSLASILDPPSSVGTAMIAGVEWVAADAYKAHALTERGIIEVHRAVDEGPERWQYKVYDAIDVLAYSSGPTFPNLASAATAAVKKSKEILP